MAKPKTDSKELDKELDNQHIEQPVSNEPVIKSIGIHRFEGGNWQLYILDTQGDKVVKREMFQSNLRGQVIDEFKIRAGILFMND